MKSDYGLLNPSEDGSSVEHYLVTLKLSEAVAYAQCAARTSTRRTVITTSTKPHDKAESRIY
jgi:hypothetical protein